jgi:hypothetical protein
MRMTLLAPRRVAAAPGFVAPRARPDAAPGRERQAMGGRFHFRSDSEALLDLADAACGGLPRHRFPGEAPGFEVDLHLLPPRPESPREPPPVRTRLDGALLHGIMDARNHVLVSPRKRRARIVASADMLERPYHLRYELIEFAMFLLAARCQGLVPLHGACVGRDGRGLLLLGESGAGKSTLALHALLRGLDFLSEDAVFVRPGDLLATGLANFLHVQSDALAGLGDAAAQRWISASPVIRRRSGGEKFEADLRRVPAPACLAPRPLQLAGIVVLSRERADGPRSLVPLRGEALAACLPVDQAYAMGQPGWDRFVGWAMQAPAHRLLRGAHPGDSVDAIERLLG